MAAGTIHIGIGLPDVDLPPFFQLLFISPPAFRHMLVGIFRRNRWWRNDRLFPASSQSQRSSGYPNDERCFHPIGPLHNPTCSFRYSDASTRRSIRSCRVMISRVFLDINSQHGLARDHQNHPDRKPSGHHKTALSLLTLLTQEQKRRVWEHREPSCSGMPSDSPAQLSDEYPW